VVVAPVPQADFIADTACAGYLTTFTDATQGLVDTWIWNFGDGTRDTVRTPTVQHLYPGPGVYVVTMTALIGGCSDAVTKGVVVVDSVHADILLSDAVICPGEAVTAIDASTGGVRWWLWDMGDGTAATGPAVPNHAYPDSGLYTIRLIVGNGHCVDTAIAQVYVIGQPQALFSVANVCEGSPVPFTNVSFPSALPVQWLWDFGNGDTSHAMTPLYAYSRPGTYTITLILHNGRCGDTLQRLITIWPKPQAAILVRDSLTRVLKETYFADVTLGTIVQRHWSLGDGTTSTAQEITYMYRDTGTYWVSLVVIDDHGGMDTAYQRVVVFGDFKMFVPTAFSPNGDGVNDFFYPGGIYFDAADFLMQIYDRLGKLIWETHTPCQGWDGRDQNTGEIVLEIQNQTSLSWIQAEFIPPVSDVCSGQLSITEEEQREDEFRVRSRASSAVYVESSTGRRSSLLFLMPPKWWVEGDRLIPFTIKNLLNEERCFGGGQPCGLAAVGGRRPHKIPPTRIQKLFASNWYYFARGGRMGLGPDGTAGRLVG